MSRKIEYPEGGFITLPDIWLGAHAERRDLAAEKSENLPRTFADFAVAMALVEDWGELPQLDGNPENWDFGEIDWRLMNWITNTVFSDLNAELIVKKKPLSP